MKKLLYILLFVPLALFGQENYSLSFDGVNDYVKINAGSDLYGNQGDFTLQFRITLSQSDTIPNQMPLIESNYQNNLSLHLGGADMTSFSNGIQYELSLNLADNTNQSSEFTFNSHLTLFNYNEPYTIKLKYPIHTFSLKWIQIKYGFQRLNQIYTIYRMKI